MTSQVTKDVALIARNAIDRVLEITKQEWQGLTDEDIEGAFYHAEFTKQLSWDREPDKWCHSFAAYIEAILRDKNK